MERIWITNAILAFDLAKWGWKYFQGFSKFFFIKILLSTSVIFEKRVEFKFHTWQRFLGIWKIKKNWNCQEGESQLDLLGWMVRPLEKEKIRAENLNLPKYPDFDTITISWHYNNFSISNSELGLNLNDEGKIFHR